VAAIPAEKVRRVGKVARRVEKVAAITAVKVARRVGAMHVDWTMQYRKLGN
jgi:hypothetical protein